MTRISPRIVVQKVNDEVVIINDATLDEIAVDEEEAQRLIMALHYFFPNIADPTEEPPA